ncbi:response regulator transcription factor [Granulicella sp. L60]|uniref:response regulator n=1 Tax=Granulicella sp. L60 TaxID=1641866 RepID=UPI00131C8605|nr:response regulator transcription factor [Granulicella sp. L60]
MDRPRILIADDHTLVAEAFRTLLEPEYQVIKLVADGRSLLTAAAELKPDAVLLDLGMPLLNGLDAGQELKKLLPKTKLIILTMNEDPDVASKALRHWASGYLLKKSAGIELKKAISEVLRGHSYVTPSIAQKLMDEFIRDPRPDRGKELTQRQRQVLQLLAEGRSMKEAAAVLDIAVRTIAFHKYRIMEDFGLKTNADLVRFALREHIISEN